MGPVASPGNRLMSPDVESPAGPLRTSASSQLKNWQAELGLKQMLNLGVGRDGQQQDSQ